MFSKYPTSHILSLAYHGSQNKPQYLYLEKEELIGFGFQKFRFKM